MEFAVSDFLLSNVSFKIIITLVHMEILKNTALVENTGHFGAVIVVAGSEGLKGANTSLTTRL